MVSLVFCPPKQPKPGASPHHLHGLVEHAELNQRVEVGVNRELQGPGADGTGADGTGWLPWSAWTAQAVSQANRGRKSSLGEAGSTWGTHRPWGMLGSWWAEACRSPAIPGQHAWELDSGKTFTRREAAATPGLGPWGLGCEGGHRRHLLGGWGWKAEARGLGVGGLARDGWV